MARLLSACSETPPVLNFLVSYIKETFLLRGMPFRTEARLLLMAEWWDVEF
jgi:hypothetical protein